LLLGEAAGMGRATGGRRETSAARASGLGWSAGAAVPRSSLQRLDAGEDNGAGHDAGHGEQISAAMEESRAGLGEEGEELAGLGEEGEELTGLGEELARSRRHLPHACSQRCSPARGQGVEDGRMRGIPQRGRAPYWRWGSPGLVNADWH